MLPNVYMVACIHHILYTWKSIITVEKIPLFFLWAGERKHDFWALGGAGVSNPGRRTTVHKVASLEDCITVAEMREHTTFNYVFETEMCYSGSLNDKGYTYLDADNATTTTFIRKHCNLCHKMSSANFNSVSLSNRLFVSWAEARHGPIAKNVQLEKLDSERGRGMQTHLLQQRSFQLHYLCLWCINTELPASLFGLQLNRCDVIVSNQSIQFTSETNIFVLNNCIQFQWTS